MTESADRPRRGSSGRERQTPGSRPAFDASGDRGAYEREPGDRVVRVLPDVSGLDKQFDYLVPAKWATQVSVGSIVRIDLHGRRVAGWVVGADVEPPPGVALRTVAKVSSVGPPAEVVELSRWAAKRWSGRLSTVLRTASPRRFHPSFAAPRPSSRSRLPSASSTIPRAVGELVDQALAGPHATVLRTGPADTQLEVVSAIVDRALAGYQRPGATVLIVVPSVAWSRWLAGQLRQAGHRVHLHPDGWASGPAGGVVLGARSAVWAPTGPLAAVVVLDEHDESLQEERNPTWHARDVAMERARRSSAPCVLVSPAPSLVALDRSARASVMPRSAQRKGWPVVEIIDRRNDEPGRGGLFSGRLADVLRASEQAVAILNRKGRAVMLACAACGELVKTEDGIHLMVEHDGTLIAPATGESRPLVCASCRATTLKRLRLGVGRASEELALLLNRDVDEWPKPVSGGAGAAPGPRASADPPLGGVVIGTEAALHGASRVGFRPQVVAFLDFDQELHAPRYRAAEQAMGLLVRAARLIGDRDGERRILVQTRTPEHRVLRAAQGADTDLMVAEESDLRRALGFPPAGALAEVSGAGAAAFVDPLRSADGQGALPKGLRVLGPRADGRFLVRAETDDALAETLAALPSVKETVRVVVDPPRV